MSCFGKPCQKVRYALTNTDLSNLKYTYRAQNGREHEGVLESPHHDRDIYGWFFALWWRMQFPPFSGINPTCEDGCECILGQAVTKTQEHSFTTTFQFTHNRSITITGTFEVEVSVQTGVCVPKSGTKFVSLDKEGFHPATMMAQLGGEGEPLEDFQKFDKGKA